MEEDLARIPTCDAARVCPHPVPPSLRSSAHAPKIGLPCRSGWGMGAIANHRANQSRSTNLHAVSHTPTMSYTRKSALTSIHASHPHTHSLTHAPQRARDSQAPAQSTRHPAGTGGRGKSCARAAVLRKPGDGRRIRRVRPLQACDCQIVYKCRNKCIL